MFPMHQRSADRPQGERLESSRDISWGREIKFYLSMTVMAQILYFGGSEGLLKYSEWVRSRVSQNITTPSQATASIPQVTAQQQAAIVFQQVRELTQKNIQQFQIHADRQIMTHHPDPQERQKAILRLAQINTTPSPFILGKDFASAKRP